MTKTRRCYGGKRRLNLCFPLDKFWLMKRRENLWMRMLGLQQHSVVLCFLQVLLNILNYILDKTLEDFCVNRK